MDPMTQTAPYPHRLAELVEQVKYKAKWSFSLDSFDRGQGSEGLTLSIHIITPDAYHPEIPRGVVHYFPVPPAAYDVRSWQRWLFDQILLVESHEACEFFALKDVYSFKDDSLCEACNHSVHLHDGRDESCADCHSDHGHRFVVRSEDQIYVRPYAPSHGPGNDPYLIREIGTTVDVQTSFRGVLRND